MQRSIDGSGDSILAESGERVVVDHLVFVFFSAIQFLEVLETIHVEKRETGFGDRPDISAAAFHRKNTNRLAGEWVGKFDLRAGVAAAEVGDAEICSQQVRAISQER